MLGLLLQLPAAYDARLARMLMELNTAALCPPSDLRTWSCTRCDTAYFPHGADLEVVQADRVLGDAALLALVGTLHAPVNLTVVVVRGTVDSSIRDWVVDFSAWQTPFAPTRDYNGSLVHAGLAEAWGKLQAFMT